MIIYLKIIMDAKLHVFKVFFLLRLRQTGFIFCVLAVIIDFYETLLDCINLNECIYLKYSDFVDCSIDFSYFFLFTEY